jgi:ketosteroid isomerase-like protein
MNTTEIAQAFTALLKEGKFKEAEDQFWSPDLVSLEAMDGPMSRCEGLAQVHAKGEWWYANHDVHGMTAEGPWVHGDQFVLAFDLDFTPKTGEGAGQRIQSKEAAVYTVRDGKIVEERFFY